MTAVEWYNEQLNMYGDMAFNKEISLGQYHIKKQELLKQAKEIEKQEQKDMFVIGYLTRAMKKNKLPYGMKFMTKSAEIEEKAEIVYNKNFKNIKE